MLSVFKLFIKGSQFIIEGGSLIAFLKSKNLNLYYYYDNIYNFIQNDDISFGNRYGHIECFRGKYKELFLKSYLNDTIKDLNNTYPVKLLVDTFLYQPVKTIFCLSDDNSLNKFYITKGNKKIIAYDILGLTQAHMLLVSKKSLNNQISTDEELYYLLKKINPENDSYKVIIDSENYHIHFMESIETLGKWRVLDFDNNQMINNTFPEIPCKVRFLGKAYTDDERIMPTEQNDYYCRIYSENKINIDLDYLFFCSSNTFYKFKTRVGTTLDQKIKVEYCWEDPAVASDFFIPNPV